MNGTRRIEKIRREHKIHEFDCGEKYEALSIWLKKFGLQKEGANAAKTYIGLEDDKVIGFYSLAVGQCAYEDAPERIKKGLARHPVPFMLLARLAVHKDYQQKGVGRALLSRTSVCFALP